METKDIDTDSPFNELANALQLDPLEDHSHDEAEIAPQSEEKQREKLVKLPMAKVKSLIRSDPDVNMVNLEAVFLIAKSTVMISNQIKSHFLLQRIVIF